jgi:hypothetical protein
MTDVGARHAECDAVDVRIIGGLRVHCAPTSPNFRHSLHWIVSKLPLAFLKTRS